MSESDSRAQFEKWISSPPYELTTKRLPESSAWPGQYNDINVQRAWEAWKQCDSRYQSCVAVSTMESVCHVFRTEEDFRQWIMAHRDSQSGSFAWVDGIQLHE